MDGGGADQLAVIHADDLRSELDRDTFALTQEELERLVLPPFRLTKRG